MTPQEQAEELVESFDIFDDWEDRYRFLIDLGREMPPLDEADKTEANRVQGCQSNVWLAPVVHHEADGDVIEFRADSDSAIVKGLTAILRKVYSGQSAPAILAFDINGLLEQLDLNQHLSMNRRNGLYGMVQRIQSLARAAYPQPPP